MREYEEVQPYTEKQTSRLTGIEILGLSLLRRKPLPPSTGKALLMPGHADAEYHED